MTPYRTTAAAPDKRPDPDPTPDDDPIILWLALVVSLIGLIPRLLARGAWGAEPTIALLIATASSTLLVRRAWRGKRGKPR